MTEIKWGRTPHSAISIPHLNGSFPVFILGWTIGAIGMECDGMTSLSSTRHVASDQSADMSAHSKSALLAASKQLAAS
jgi:hypothetical protein